MLEGIEHEKLYLSYEGPFSIQIISSLARIVLENIPASESARQKLYRVFIELAQNVGLYSYDRMDIANNHSPDIGIGKICVVDNFDHFQCFTVNKIANEHGEILRNNCMEINNSTMHDLRIKKKALRKMAGFKDTGAHIGLIMIYINSGNPLGCEVFEESTDYKYFKICATILKNDS
jgi:hypothetical protein